MGERAKPLRTGITILVGVPGSGKTYRAVVKIIDTVLYARRVVYTNIPIRLAKLRAYLVLKGGDRKFARYIRPLTRQHFVRFARRLALIKTETERLLDEAGVDSKSLDVDADFDMDKLRQAAVRIVEARDPVMLTGGGANWIPPGSVLVMDELKIWFPSKGYRDEAPEVGAYTSMHRHMMHEVWVLTQRAMDVSLSFRSMAEEYMFCQDKSRIRFMFNFTLPIKAFHYERFNAISVRDGKLGIGAKPLGSEVLMPWVMRWVIYRLYRSYSHGGSVADLRREVEGIRSQVERRVPKEGPKVKVRKSLFRRLRPWRLVTWPVRKLVWVPFLLVAFWIGRGTAGRDAVSSAAAAAAVPVAGAGVVDWSGIPDLGVLGGVMPGGVLIDGVLVKKGDRYYGAELVGVDAVNGRATWSVRPDVYAVWVVGERPVFRLRVRGRGSDDPSGGRAADDSTSGGGGRGGAVGSGADDDGAVPGDVRGVRRVLPGTGGAVGLSGGPGRAADHGAVEPGPGG